MEIAIVDDLEYDCGLLSRIIHQFLESKQIACQIQTFSNGYDFLQSFTPSRYFAVFLDIWMEGISGMDIAYQIRNSSSWCAIIFVTSEESYALEGYRVQAMDYLVKPILSQQVDSVMTRIILRFHAQRYIEVNENRISLRILFDYILYVRSAGHFLEIYLDGQAMCRSYMTLESFLDQLDAMDETRERFLMLQFPVCCRGYVVNLEKATAVDSDTVFLKGNLKIPISRSRRKQMQITYADYVFARTRRHL